MSKVIRSNVRRLVTFDFHLSTKSVLYIISNIFSTFLLYLNMSMNGFCLIVYLCKRLNNSTVKPLSCGEYRSRTDGLLRARQAL